MSVVRNRNDVIASIVDKYYTSSESYIDEKSDLFEIPEEASVVEQDNTNGTLYYLGDNIKAPETSTEE